jgi:hypothetical protein
LTCVHRVDVGAVLEEGCQERHRLLVLGRRDDLEQTGSLGPASDGRAGGRTVWVVAAAEKRDDRVDVAPSTGFVERRAPEFLARCERLGRHVLRRRVLRGRGSWLR